MAMLLGVGADILRVERIRSCLDSEPFMKATFTEVEVDLARSRPDPGSYYAKLFAGKEAVFKCFGMPSDSLKSWLDIEIVDGEDGQPEVNVRGPLATVADSRGVWRVALSLSYDTDYAMAVAALTWGVDNDS